VLWDKLVPNEQHTNALVYDVIVDFVAKLHTYMCVSMHARREIGLGAAAVYFFVLRHYK